MSTRIFHDESGREWSAEMVGRTSGIVRPGAAPDETNPSDIVRFVCRSDKEQSKREITLAPGKLEDASDAELAEIMKTGREIL